MQVSTFTLRDIDELMRALEANGFVYSPKSENYEDTGEISWPRCYEAAVGATESGELYFSSELPCTITDKSVSILTIENECYIEDVFDGRTTAQVVARIAEFISGAYWADVAMGA